jgi:hypothetical protein
MDATRARFGSAVEWGVAVAFLGATVLVGSLIVRELRVAAPAADGVRAAERAAAALPAGVPTRAISVPVLLLLDGKEIRVGDSVDHIATLLGRAAEVGTQVVERGPIGERLTRFYEHAGSRFVLVFEPFEAKGPPRVAGIYIQ